MNEVLGIYWAGIDNQEILMSSTTSEWREKGVPLALKGSIDLRQLLEVECKFKLECGLGTTKDLFVAFKVKIINSMSFLFLQNIKMKGVRLMNKTVRILKKANVLF